ncbi:MarR family winged helix-turn-helix transcriptional regulator [Glycomyces xiaoerkulensis]|uniref:MarR family winged helix-turn-helix transcriptional regulator n=1 Tax=Glycomyces xiaoerkulensis TaxID=2038139 RepID=UPI000C25D9F7|nr:MarR family winged helix-turn-helix transcriptional regulator [Glycomyces xiaoerkulensis]
MDTPKPIGYWLKHLHNLMERHFEASLEGLNLGRRHWQVLNVLYVGARTPDDLDEALEPFWDGEGIALEEVLDGSDGLVTRGWVKRGPILLSLTDDGFDAYQRVAARIDRARETILTGLSPEQYAETIRNLSIMSENIERSLRKPR